MLHTIYDKAKHPSQTIIGNDVSVGHNAVVHGARIGDNCLIGMGAILLDNAVIPSGCIIAAGALVLSNAQLEPDPLPRGVPAKRYPGGDPRSSARRSCSARHATTCTTPRGSGDGERPKANRRNNPFPCGCNPDIPTSC